MKNRLISRQLLAGAAAVLALSTGIPVISASQYGSSQITGSNTAGSSVDGTATGNIGNETAGNAGSGTTGNSLAADAATVNGSVSTAGIGTGNSTEEDLLQVTDISAECDLSGIAPGTVEVSFETEDYYVATNAEIDVSLIVKGGQDLGEFNLVLVYDDVRLEYLSGGSYLTKGKIILNGQAESRAMKFNLKFRTNYNGNGGIYVRNAYFCSKDNGIEMTVPEKPGAAIAIVGLESTEQPDFSLQRNEQNYGLDTEIPLVGRVTWSDGSNQYIIDLSCYVPDVVDFNYTLSGDIFNDILLTMFKSQDGTVRLVYLMDQNKDLNLCAFNDGKMYPVTKNGGNYFLSAYAISEWPDGLTKEIVDKESVFYMLNANGLGAFAKYYKNDIVSWEYKSQIEIVTTEEEEPFYTFREDGKVTPKSFWKGFTSHIEISLLIFFVLIGLITLILRLLRGAVRGKKARKYKKNLPPEIPYDEEMKEQERIVREARLDEMKQERARIREERKAEQAARAKAEAEAQAALEANEQAIAQAKAEQAAKTKAEAEEKAEELRTAREKAERLYAKAKLAVKKARKERKAADQALELAVDEKEKAEAQAAKVAREAKAARIAAKKASRKKAAAEQATLDRTVKDGATGYLPNLADLDGDMISSAEVAERIAAAKEATGKESAAKLLLEEAVAREAEARAAAAEAAEKEEAAVKKLASREASAKKAAAKEAAQEKVLRDLMSGKADAQTEVKAEADEVAAKGAKCAAQVKKTKKAKAAKVTPEMEAAEAERIAREKAELKARVEAERIAWKTEAAEAERKAREEAELIAREEAERITWEAEEAERLVREEAERQASEAAEAEQIAQEEAECLAREEAEAARLAMEAEQRYAREAAIAEQRAWETAEAERIAREEEEAEAAENAQDPADEDANDPFAKLNELLTESSGKTKRNAKRKAGTISRTGRGRESAERLEMGTLSEDFNRTPKHQKSEFTMDLKRAIREFELDPEE